MKQVDSVIGRHIGRGSKLVIEHSSSSSIVKVHRPELAFGTVSSCIAKEPSHLIGDVPGSAALS